MFILKQALEIPFPEFTERDFQIVIYYGRFEMLFELKVKTAQV